jgi:uncharacterized protein (TIGR02231 family)
MQRLLFVLASVLFLSATYGQPAPVSVKGQLKTVTVYPNKARLEYEGPLSLPAGVSKITFTNLPESVDWGSVQLGFSERGISMENISVNRNYLKPKDQEPELARLSQRQDSLQKVVQWANQRWEILNGEESLLKANQQVYSEQSGVTVSALQQLLHFYREETTRIRRERMDNGAVLNKAQMEWAALQNQIEKLRAVNAQSVVEVTVDVRAQRAGRSDYNLSMMARNAAWEAVYDIRATAVDAPLQVTFRAVVRQSTGENWNNVNLVLSTAVPALNNRHPVPEPRYARILTDLVDTIMVMNPDAYEELLQIVKTVPEEEVWSNRAYNPTNTTFTLAAKQSIPSDNAGHYVTVREMSIPAKMQHYTVPRQTPHVYLLAEFVNNSEYDLQSGKARIFNESVFVGETEINIETLSDTLQISLGIDPGVFVKRERRDFGANQWIGAYRQETFDFSIGVRNNKNVPIEVKLLDQIPISTDKQIEISLLKKDNATHNEARGELVWQLRCQPGKTETRSFSYRMKYPKDAIVEGKW